MIRTQLANMVTASRIGLSIAAACLASQPRLAFWLYVAAITTDIIDGPIARALKTTSTLGARLDPLADWIMGAVGFTSLLIVGWLPIWSLLAIGAPTILLAATRFVRFPRTPQLILKLIGATFFTGVYAWISLGFLARAYGWSDLYWALLGLAVLAIGLVEWPKIRRWVTTSA
ncbi:MAG TPA: CDP-alcohol phosphatidyltransferase family protein [Candidatus Saccharimonadia bacterium]|nr:CDP-alcohol phosphatidyltransferase family protein [Candidatus Saccharimonadia bacterium]